MSGLPFGLTDPDLFLEQEDYFDYPVGFVGRVFGLAAPITTPSAGTSLTGRQNINVSINGNSQPIEFVIDSGADYNIIRPDSAKLVNLDFTKPISQKNITTAGGQTHTAPVINATFSIEGQPTINVELVLLQESPFNLIRTETVAQSFTATINPNGGFDLVPKTGAQPQQPQQQQQPITPATPSTPVQTPTNIPILKQTGNMILDMIRELYRTLCAAAATTKIPFLCNSPWHFMAALTVLAVLILVFALSGI